MIHAFSRRAVFGASVIMVVMIGLASSVWAFEPKPGDAIEVREGDVWSSAEFVKQEGRRFQIRYDDGTEEWITSDRMRAAGSSGSVDEASGTADAPAEPKAQPRKFRRGQKIELKNHNSWKSARIERVSGELYLVATNDSWGEKQFYWKWVDAARLRTPGEDYEGPDVWSQFEHKLSSDSIQASSRKARAAYQEHKNEQKEKEEDKAYKEDYDPFAPPPLKVEASEADRSQLQAYMAQPGPGMDAVKPDAGAEVPLRRMSMRMRAGKGEFFEKVKALGVNGRFALVAVEDGAPGKAKKMYVERFDMASGRSTAAASIDAGTLPMAISADGELIAGRSNGFHSGTLSRLDIWGWQAAEPAHVISFTPFDDSSKHENDIQGIAFIDYDRVLVSSKGGKISAWDARSGTGLWEVSGFDLNSKAWALSPGRAYVACGTESGIHLLQTQDGQTAATLPGALTGVRAFAFSANGRYIAASGKGWFKVWDLQESVALPSVALPPETGDALVMHDQGQVQVGGRVHDAKTGSYVWQIDQPNSIKALSATSQGMQVMTVPGSGKSRDGFSVSQPPAGLANASGDGAIDLLANGASISIDLSGLSLSSDERRALKSKLNAEMSRRGVSVMDNQHVRLVAATTNKSETRTYETRGHEYGRSGKQEQQVNVNIQTTRFAIEVAGETAWEQTTVFSPSSLVRIEEGQSMQQAVDASSGGDVAGFIAGVMIPDIVPDPRQGPASASSVGGARPSR